MSVTKFEHHSWAHELGCWFCNCCWMAGAIPSMINHALGCENGCLGVDGNPRNEEARIRLRELGMLPVAEPAPPEKEKTDEQSR